VMRQRPMESQSSAAGLNWAHPVLDGLPGGVNVRPSFTAFEQGPIEPTNKPLDVAIEGDGFFEVSDGQRTRYTRDGSFTINAAGSLVMSAGNGRWRVLDENGNPIVVDPAGGVPEVSSNGTVRQGGEIVGKLSLKTTDHKQTLQKTGENLFETSSPMTSTAVRLIPEALEGSTVDPVQGLASMIEATRAFQMNATMIRIQDELAGLATSTLGRFA